MLANPAFARMAPALRGGTFTSNWNDLALSELMHRIYQTMPANAPQSSARMNPGRSTGRMPENVFVSDRAMATAGLANEVEAVNQ